MQLLVMMSWLSHKNGGFVELLNLMDAPDYYSISVFHSVMPKLALDHRELMMCNKQEVPPDQTSTVQYHC